MMNKLIDKLTTEYNTKFDEIMDDKYKTRLYNLIKTIKGWMK